MNKLLRSTLLVLAAAACFLLLAIGTLAALYLAFLGFLGFIAGFSSADVRLTGIALFGLITVGLCSVCCFGGLAYLFNGCLENLGSASYPLEKPLILMALLSVIATVCSIFMSTQGEWFLPTCIAADIVHILSIIVYLRHRKRSRPCARSSSSSPDSPPCSPPSTGC